MNNTVSVVVPVYGSAEILGAFYERCSNVLSSLTDDWEMILVDDGSPDGAWQRMQALRSADRRVRIVRFARNHGQQHATLCGLGYAKKDFVITIDDDLQCYPEDIPAFVDALSGRGKHVIIGSIQEVKQHGIFRNLASRMNQYVAGKVLGKPDWLRLSSFRGMTREVAHRLTEYRGAHPHIAALLLKTVPRDGIANIPIRHAKRASGKSSYSLPKLLKTFSYLLVNHSYLPLRFMVIWGSCISLLSIAYAIWVLIGTLSGPYRPTGWTSLAVLISFLSGNILLAMGVLGEYVGRLVEESSVSGQFSIFEESVE